jgi:uncharacterized membrane protein YphA (DoxX/SURF4 family)
VREWVGLVLRVVVGGVWIFAAALKLPDPAQSVAAVRAYQLLPASLVTPVGQLLPVIEMVVGVMLVIGLLTRGAAVISAILFVAFIIGIASVWARGINIDCGCFGGGGAVDSSQTKYLQEILRDTGLLLLAGWLLWRPRSRFSADGWLGEGSR